MVWKIHVTNCFFITCVTITQKKEQAWIKFLDEGIPSERVFPACTAGSFLWMLWVWCSKVPLPVKFMFTAHWSKVQTGCRGVCNVATSANEFVLSCQCLFTAALVTAVTQITKHYLACTIWKSYYIQCVCLCVTECVWSMAADNFLWQACWHSDWMKPLCFPCTAERRRLSLKLGAQSLQSWFHFCVEGFVCERSEGISFSSSGTVE